MSEAVDVVVHCAFETPELDALAVEEILGALDAQDPPGDAFGRGAAGNGDVGHVGHLAKERETARGERETAIERVNSMARLRATAFAGYEIGWDVARSCGADRPLPPVRRSR